LRISIGSDERTSLTDFVVAELRRRGHELTCFGPLAGNAMLWPDVAAEVAHAVESGACEQGVVFCWTGTGVCIAANKVRGVRAALCSDAYTAGGARRWNDANVLALSLRGTSEAVAKEILDEWFKPYTIENSDAACVQRVAAIEAECSKEIQNS
jgi:ribose 5-phosphate isomerase B